MRKTFIALAGVAALALSSTAANAAALVVGGTTNVTVPESDTFGNSFGSAAAPIGPMMFTDTYGINLSGPSLGNGSLISVSLSGGNNIDFTCATCTVKLDSTAFGLVSGGGLDVFTLAPTSLSGGLHTLTITGNIVTGPTAAYSGTVNFNLPLPEPATWAMMLLGFGAIGFSMRSRRRPALAQVA